MLKLTRRAFLLVTTAATALVGAAWASIGPKHRWALNRDACARCGLTGMALVEHGDPGCHVDFRGFRVGRGHSTKSDTLDFLFGD